MCDRTHQCGKPDCYYNFSQEAICDSIQRIIKETQEATGATDEEMQLALGDVARKFMNINCMALEGGPDDDKKA